MNHSSVHRSIVGLSLAVAAVACSASGSSVVYLYPDGGVPTSGNGGGNGGGGGDGGSGGSTPKYSGAVTLSQTESPQASFFASAYFYETAAGAASSLCTTTKNDPCTVTVCDLKSTTTSDAGTSTFPTAGTIGLSGGGLGSAKLTPNNSTGQYTALTLQDLVMQAGDTMAVDAKGGDLPGFSGSVEAPGALQLTSPKVSLSAPLSVSRKADLTLTWKAGGTGNVQVTVSSTQLKVRSVTVACTFDRAAGTGTVPGNALGNLDKMDGKTIYGSFAAQPINKSDASVADANITLMAIGGSQVSSAVASN